MKDVVSSIGLEVELYHVLNTYIVEALKKYDFHFSWQKSIAYIIYICFKWSLAKPALVLVMQLQIMNDYHYSFL